MRRLFRILMLGVLGVIVGTILYEMIMFVRVYRLRSHNPSSTSLIDIRASEAEAKGQQPKREQIWVPLDKISTNLQRAVQRRPAASASAKRDSSISAFR